MRGLPTGSVFDFYFTLDSESKDDWILSGATNSRIEWNNETKKWQLTIINESDFGLSRDPLLGGKMVYRIMFLSLYF